MRNKILFALVAVGLVAGLISAFIYTRRPTPLPPVFTPAPNPFADGVYASGIIETDQSHGQNTSIYPEVTGVVVSIRANEGQRVHRGDVLLALDDSVARATAAQLAAQTQAARAALDELRAQPRKETLAVVRAQVEVAAATLASVRSNLAKQQHSFELDPRSVSKLVLDDAANAVLAAEANLDVAKRQHALTKAGAWIYDIRNQAHQVEALAQAQLSAEATLRKYTLRAPRDGELLTVAASVGAYVSPQGVYNAYTQQDDPVITMGENAGLAVRVYVDEILVPRMPDPARLVARMYVRGTNVSIPLQFVRVQPYVTPKIALSNERTEKVDLRVLPVLFRFTTPRSTRLYPGQLVDVYLTEQTAEPTPRPPPTRAAHGEGARP